jgi:putative NIF3 family GTP cyclohydrolase 1 type 2
MTPLSLSEMAGFLNAYLQVGLFPNDLNGIYRSSARWINRIGLALEPFPELEQWIDDYSLDAVLLHRPWKLQMTPALHRACIGFLAYHLPFDERLTIGYNVLLAQKLGMTDLKVLGEKEGRPLGMIGNIVSTDFYTLRNWLQQEFRGEEKSFPGAQYSVRRVAIVGALNSNLIQQAIDQQADTYITGQWRPDVSTAGLAFFATGHQRCEMWGLRALSEVLQQQWPGLKVVVYENQQPEKNPRMNAFS